MEEIIYDQLLCTVLLRSFSIPSKTMSLLGYFFFIHTLSLEFCYYEMLLQRQSILSLIKL